MTRLLRNRSILRESERLYTTLLNSISHELRTPLATVTGAASSLLDENTVLTDQSRSELIGEIQSAADRLNRLVENLLDMSRLDAGRLQLKLEWCDIGDVIGVALRTLRNVLGKRPVQVTVAPDTPLIMLDFVLMEQVLVNLLDNARATRRRMRRSQSKRHLRKGKLVRIAYSIAVQAFQPTRLGAHFR